MANTNKDKTINEQPLSKTLAFLSRMAGTCASLSVVEIAEELKVSKPTAYAIVNSLASQNFLEKDPDNGKYHIGYSFYALGQNYPRLYPFLTYADSFVTKLHERLGLRINLCVYKEPMTALVIASKDESLLPRHIGSYLLPAHVSASGKVLLSSLSKDIAEEHIRSAELFPVTSKTITNADELINSLDEVRRLGYACDIEELVPGSACIAAPVYNASGNVIYSLSVSKCPIERFNAEKDYLIQELKKTAYQISVEMGYSLDVWHKFM